MKNIHILPTDKPSRLLYFGTSNELTLQVNPATFRVFERSPQHIYITSDEEIKKGDYFYSPFKWEERLLKYNKFVIPFPKDKKIILTTDQDLIKDGVQAIDDEFVEWFVKNPTCEKIEIIYGLFNPLGRQVNPKDTSQNHSMCGWGYKIIIPKEEPIYTALLQPVGTRQETLENKLKSLVEKWQVRQNQYVDIAYEKVDDAHTNRKFTYKAMATRDCWKELLKLIENEK